MWGFLKITVLVFAAPVACFGLWLGSLIWRSPDYARAGTCSTEDVLKTRAAIDDMHMHHDTAVMRIRHENDLFNGRPRTLAGAVQNGFSVLVFKTWDKGNSAAFFCNHAYVRPGGRPPFRTLPKAAAWLRPHTRNETQSWRLATCISYSNYSPRFPDGYTTDIPALREVCDIRRDARIKRGE